MSELLLDKIKEGMPSYKTSVLKNLLIIVLSLLKKGSCNLYKLRATIGNVCENSTNKPSSNYKRVLRFFRSNALSALWLDLLSYGFSLLRLKADYLALDGTSWEHGKRKLHLLTLCVIYKDVAIPIYWEDLSKKGTSNMAERQLLLTKAASLFNLEGKTLLADREYIGVNWFRTLLSLKIDFIIRLKKNSYKVNINQAAGKTYGTLERKIRRSKKKVRIVSKTFNLDELELRVIMTKNLARDDKDAIIYLITNKKEAANKLANAYFIRWKIETCFRHMKSNGFDLESINLADKNRARLLIALIVFAYTISILEGLKQYKQVKMKKYSNQTQYKLVSVFREGIDRVVILCNNFKNFCTYIIQQKIDAKRKHKSPKAIFVQ